MRAFRSFSSATARVSNFNAGPAGLPLPVLEQAQRELLTWGKAGMGVMEMSHRSKEYESIHNKATANLREILKVPDNFHVLFLQGGATTQFAAVPCNLIGRSTTKSADYIVTGDWSKKAAQEAKKYGTVNIVASGQASKFTSIPEVGTWKRSGGTAAYVHYCANETVHGVEFKDVPGGFDANVPLVADMSSNFMSRPVDVGKFGLIYAGAQKNVGPAGLTIVLVRKELVGGALPITPVMLDYKTMAESDSLYNTAPTFAIYMAGLVFEWMKQLGGLDAMAARNAEKAQLLYSAIDASHGFYKNPVSLAHRSYMNVPFRVGKGTDVKDFTDTEAKFVKEAKAAGMEGLKGHRAVGGIRASIYNAVSLQDVQKLVKFMHAFQKDNQ